MGTGGEGRGKRESAPERPVPRPPSPVPVKLSTARNSPTAGSSGVVVTLRTSSVPSAPSATRSVKVPPTSTPTRITSTPTRKSERGTRNRSDLGRSTKLASRAERRTIRSAFRVSRSAFSRPRSPPLHHQHAGEPQRGQDAQRPHPIAQPHVQRGHVARPQRGGDRRLHLESGGIVVAAQRI